MTLEERIKQLKNNLEKADCFGLPEYVDETLEIIQELETKQEINDCLIDLAYCNGFRAGQNCEDEDSIEVRRKEALKTLKHCKAKLLGE